MKKVYVLLNLFILLLYLTGCSPPVQGVEESVAISEDSSSNNLKDQGHDTGSSSRIVGSITNVRTNVQAGPLRNLKNIEEKSDLGNDDFVKVTDGGKARLEFPGPINLLLYNETEIDNIKADIDENSNPRIANRLIRGGLSGYVSPGENLTIDLAFGVRVTVLGTQFFIIFDEETGYITIGKINGVVIVDMSTQKNMYLDDNEMIDIAREGQMWVYSKLPFTLNQFEKAADECDSPIQGLNILRRDNNIPLPGDVLIARDQNLPCGSLPPQTIIPVTGCQSYTVHVKVDKVDMREGPDVRYNKVGEYILGTEYTITGHYTDVWFFGEMPDGTKGWLYIDWLEIPSTVDIDNLCQIKRPPTPVVCYSGKYNQDNDCSK